jgi:hypothetical protein
MCSEGKFIINNIYISEKGRKILLPGVFCIVITYLSNDKSYAVATRQGQDEFIIKIYNDEHQEISGYVNLTIFGDN